MKLQYLGDSKDAFKWDYHAYLASSLRFPTLTIVPMLTPDDGGGDGNTQPEGYPAKRILEFCRSLRKDGKLEYLSKLKEFTGPDCSVSLHKQGVHFNRQSRPGYFSDLASSGRQLVFADPDNGFQPERRVNEKHIRYDEVTRLLDQVSLDSVLSVFQHFRRISFPDDFTRIKERLGSLHSTAVYWHSLMFVAVGQSAEVIAGVADANAKYAHTHPVKVVA